MKRDKMNRENYEWLLSIISIILFPLVILYLLYRLIRGKEKTERILERFSIPSDIQAPNLIWVHAASVGETVIAFTIIDIILKTKKDAKFLITSGTITSADLANNKMESYNFNPDNQVITHQFLPIDNVFIIRKFLNYWDPKLAIFIESELWPSILSETSKRIPVLLVNGKMSSRSFSRWKNFRWLTEKIGESFKEVLVQSEYDKVHYDALGFKNVKLFGNIKYVQKDNQVDNNFHLALKKHLDGKEVIFAASTHAPEEEIVVDVFTKLKKKRENLFLIIAPRHPNRLADVLRTVLNKKITCAIRSHDEKIIKKTSVYILDTMGEMSAIFKLKPITIMGGSFSIGGHNILEPAKYESPIIFGPNMTNFEEISKEFLSNNAAIQVRNKDDLYYALERFLDMSKKDLKSYTKSAHDIIDSKQNIEKDYKKIFDSYL